MRIITRMVFLFSIFMLGTSWAATCDQSFSWILPYKQEFYSGKDDQARCVRACEAERDARCGGCTKEAKKSFSWSGGWVTADNSYWLCLNDAGNKCIENCRTAHKN